MYHDQQTKKLRGTKLSPQQEVSHFDSKFPFHPHFLHIHASYFNELLLQIEHHRLPIHSVSPSHLEHEKLSKASVYVKHGGCQVLITSTYNFPCTPNSSHMYMMSPSITHASILCHIHSATYWTQIIRKTSYLHDIYRYFLHIIHYKMTCS